MPLNWPLKFKFVSFSNDGAGTGILLRVQVVDSTSAVVKDVVVNIGKQATFPEVLAAVREQVDQAAVAAAGTRAAFLNNLITNGTLFDV